MMIKKIIPSISVKLKKVNYHLPLKSKYTFITGDSGIGKSTFITVIEQNLYTVTTGYVIKALPKDEEDGYDILNKYASNEKVILVADEDFAYMHHESFQQLMAETKCLFVLVERYPFSSLSYAAADIVHFDNTRNHNLMSTYNYELELVRWQDVRNVIIEDSGSGLAFFKGVYTNVKTSCGKDNMRKLIAHEYNTLFIADSLGVGSSIQAIHNALQENYDRCNQLLLIDSFEAMVLQSEFISKWTEPPINCPNKEEYSTRLLADYLRLYGISYSKNGNNPCLTIYCCFRQEKCGLCKHGCKQQLIAGPIYDGLKFIQ